MVVESPRRGRATARSGRGHGAADQRPPRPREDARHGDRLHLSAGARRELAISHLDVEVKDLRAGKALEVALHAAVLAEKQNFHLDLKTAPLPASLVPVPEKLVLKSEPIDLTPLGPFLGPEVGLQAGSLQADWTALLGAAVVGTAEVPAGEGIELPWTALTVSGTSPAVWRIGADDRVAIAPVEVERYETGVVVVRAGVTSGEVVVGEGSQLMYPGRQVRRGTPRP